MGMFYRIAREFHRQSEENTSTVFIVGQTVEIWGEGFTTAHPDLHQNFAEEQHMESVSESGETIRRVE